MIFSLILVLDGQLHHQFLLELPFIGDEMVLFG